MAKTEKLLELATAHLHEGENVLAVVQGTYETKRFGQDTVRAGILIATDSRVVFWAKRLGGFDLESFEYRTISSFEQSKTLMGNTIQFFASGNKVSVKWIPATEQIAAFVSTVREHLKGSSAPVPAPAAAAPAGDDILEQLRKLGELRDAGIVTPEEFEAKKSEMLARL